VQRVKAESKTAGGIFLPESAVKELNEAKVLAVGPGAFDKEGKRVAVSVKPGDKVLIPQVRNILCEGGGGGGGGRLGGGGNGLEEGRTGYGVVIGGMGWKEEGIF
jgi:co-chaperonin GroES (HSP10)